MPLRPAKRPTWVPAGRVRPAFANPKPQMPGRRAALGSDKPRPGMPPPARAQRANPAAGCAAGGAAGRARTKVASAATTAAVSNSTNTATPPTAPDAADQITTPAAAAAVTTPAAVETPAATIATGGESESSSAADVDMAPSSPVDVTDGGPSSDVDVAELREQLMCRQMEVEFLLRPSLSDAAALAAARTNVSNALAFDMELAELAAAHDMSKGRLFQALLEEVRACACAVRAAARTA